MNRIMKTLRYGAYMALLLWGVILNAVSCAGEGDEESAPEVVNVQSVTLNTSELEMEVGDSETLSFTILPENATNRNVTWQSSNPSVAEVSKGVVTAVSEGSTTITVTTIDGNKSAACAITVKPATPQIVPVTGVGLNLSTLTMQVGETEQLTATVLPGDATNIEVVWESDNNDIVKVVEGLVSAVAPGSAIITVTTVDGGYTATCNVEVLDDAPEIIPVTGVGLNKSTLTLKVGDSESLVATVIPGDATNQNVNWQSSAPDVVQVEDGTITALKSGSAEITVTTEDGGYTATCTVTVEEEIVVPPVINVTSVGLSKSSIVLKIGDVETLIASVLPGDATNQNVSWESSDDGVANVVDGVVSATGAGTAIITVTTEDGGFTATCTVTVEEEIVVPPVINVTSVGLSKSSIVLNVGDSETLIASVLPGDATNQSVSWESSDKEVADVVDGVVTANSSGTAIITVTTEDGGFTATCTVTVKKEIIVPPIVNVTSVGLNKSSVALNIGDIETLIATVLPLDATNQNVSWESNEKGVADVVDGVVTAIGSGTAIITVTTEDGGFTATCMVTVEEEIVVPPVINVTNVGLDKSNLTLKVDESATLVATVYPGDATNQNVSWESSDKGVADVVNGVVKAVGSGTATITVTTEDGGFTATCTVTVEEEIVVPPVINVTNVGLDKSNLTLKVDESATLVATVYPGDATNQNVSWESSDKGVADVVGGVVTAIGSGTAIITVTTEDGGFTATCTVTVEEEIVVPPVINVTNVGLDKSNLTLKVDESATLVATVYPGDATNQNVSWESSDDGVANVVDGVVTAIGSGTAIIIVTTEDGGFTATCTVTVEEEVVVPPVIDVTNVGLDKSTLTLKVDESATLVATVYPGDATNQNVSWESSDNGVANVVDGVVTAIGSGTAIITVTTEDGGFTATCTVTVEEEIVVPPVVPVASVGLNKSSLTMQIGNSVTLIATVYPGDATNKSVVWQSSDSDVIKVSDSGTVTAVGEGSAIITVSTVDGGKSATCYVEVKNPSDDDKEVNNGENEGVDFEDWN